ncbi:MULTISPECIES: hypothetical protein [Methylophaga]|uniref:Uncharacterized protein n=1 Tax=Methylophaga muralis TaxID=291169 RepID=A0A1E3GNA9_9GAMM|nr:MULTISPECIES: hypothetical protein [Methylophaga]ODN65542.1 hypothetical protein A9E74_02675 [Methylophaga muralis]THK42147.1 hypothetical protein E8Q33_05015 [Methylophaga sp. SB9B]
MFKTIVFTATLAFTSFMLSGCSDEQDNQVGQDVNPEWSENPYEDERAVQNPEPTDEINRNREGDQLNENNTDSDETGLDEATEQGIGQQY